MASLYMSRGTGGLSSMVLGSFFEASEARQNDGAEYQDAPPEVGRACALRDTVCLGLGFSLSGFGATTTTGGLAAGCPESRISPIMDQPIHELCIH